MSEAALWKYLKKGVGHLGHWSRVESHATADGIPDVDFCVKGKEGKIELKFCATDKIPYRFIRQSQLRWITKRTENGGNVWILAKIGDTYYLIYGTSIKYLSGSTSTITWNNVAHKKWIGNINWDEFLRLVIGDDYN